MNTESIIRQNVNPKIEDFMGKLLNMEHTSKYYLEAMAFYFSSSTVALPGLGQFLQDLSVREKKHADRVVLHMQGRGFTINLDDITKPSTPTWGSPLSAMMTCLEMVKSLNENWLQLHKMCIKYEDPCTEVLVKKFICEHVRLISVLGRHVSNLKRIGEDGTGTYLYDLKSFRGELIPKIGMSDTDFDTILH